VKPSPPGARREDGQTTGRTVEQCQFQQRVFVGRRFKGPLGHSGRPLIIARANPARPRIKSRVTPPCAPFAGRRSVCFAAGFLRSAPLPDAARAGFSASTDRRRASMRFTTFVGAAASGYRSIGIPCLLALQHLDDGGLVAVLEFRWVEVPGLGL
jgi:hypothetical protein